jgi:hypothetical protein
MVDHPYKNPAPYRSWRKSLAALPPEEVDPVARFPMRVSPQDKVATAGSCFAQHLARRLNAGGFTYFVTEPGHAFADAEERKTYNYGIFSARYGNVYTSRQLLQLWRRAFGEFEPLDDHWRSGDRYIDPCRPAIQPHGFSSLQELQLDRRCHLAAVRRMFQDLDVFIFTLGLTEGFIDRRDGLAYPVCPGVAGGEYDPNLHEFVNEGVQDVVDNLDAFLTALRRLNPASRVILTVSPVPPITTALDRHVLQSTTYSKAVLRVAAEQIVTRHEAVAYFPSYEVITSNSNRGAYFREDLREIREEGVDHVMRLFFRHATVAPAPASAPARRDAPRSADFIKARQREVVVVCEEELLDFAP